MLYLYYALCSADMPYSTVYYIILYYSIPTLV